MDGAGKIASIGGRQSMPSLFKYFDGRKLLAFKKFQKCTARGGDIRYFVINIVFLNRGDRVAATRQGKGCP